MCRHALSCFWLTLGLSFALASPALGQMRCGKGKTRDAKICKGKQRDVRGCCKIPKHKKRKRRVKRTTKSRAKAKACSPGQVRSAETSNKCCYPGQYWSKRQRKCKGEPICPEELGMVSIGERCGCTEGQEVNRFTEGHCCWKGQEWVRGRGCVGEMTKKARAIYERAERERIERERIERANRTGIKWIKVPSGSYDMGSSGGSSDEQPIHRVSVSAFEMSETEVTVGQYRKCVDAGVCTNPNTGGECTWGGDGYDDHPVNCVTWGEARTYARWAGGDLPTEAQWEYAARGGQNRRYAGADSLDGIAWYYMNAGSSTHRVKQKRANGYGLYDMSGNVWEWTLDEYHESYSGAPGRGETPWGGLPTCDQRCSNGSIQRVNRGGSWYSNAVYLRVATRNKYSPSDHSNNLGFRVRRTLP